MMKYNSSIYFISRDKVLGLAYAGGCKQLLTGSEDCILGIWNMDIDRQEVRTKLVKVKP